MGAMKQADKKQAEIEAESRRRTQQILDDEEAMRGIYESLEEVKRGERGVPGKDLLRKYKRASALLSSSGRTRL